VGNARELLLRGEDADPVRLAVGDIDNAGGAEQHGMRPRERAAPRVAVGPVAALAGAEHCPRMPEMVFRL
jgi:hypothetical protein